MLELLYIFVHSIWNVIGQMAPYLLLGYLIAGVLSVFVTADTVKSHLGGSRFSSTLKAALFGMPLPLCSCSVIPVTASLYKSGAGKGAVASFLISTPTTGVDSIMAAWALMGPLFAIYRAAMSILLGIVTGVFVNAFGENEIAPAVESKDDVHADSCSCTSEKKTSGSRLLSALKYGFITLPKDLGKPLFVGILIASLISALIDAHFIDQFLGGGIGTMAIMLVLGVPLYVCATASIPLALGFMALGATPGAAFVFLIAGPATNAATITVLWKMIGKKSTIILLTCMLVGALGGGLALDAVWGYLGTDMSAAVSHSGEHSSGIYSVFALVFIAVQLWALFQGKIIGYISGGSRVVEDSCCSSVKKEVVQSDCCHSGAAEVRVSSDCCGNDNKNASEACSDSVCCEDEKVKQTDKTATDGSDKPCCCDKK